MGKRKIRVFVVEDEAILLRNMEKKIRAVSEDFEIAGEAFDGMEALEKIREDCPDLVFTDIRMPVMDGLELARILREEFPELMMVIVSGYDEFEYARTALQYQVRNYLLKPLQAEALREVLFSLQDAIEQQRRRQTEDFLKRCLDGNPGQEALEKAGDAVGKSRYYLFLVCLGNLCMGAKRGQQARETDSGDLVRKALAQTDSLLAWESWVFPGKEKNLCLVLAEEQPGLPGPSQLAERIQKELLGRDTDEICNVVYSGRALDCLKLWREGEELYEFLEESLVMGRSSLLSLGAPGLELPSAALPAASLQYLQTLIHNGNAAGFEKQLLQLFEEWERKSRPQQWIGRQLSQILNLIQRAEGLPESAYVQGWDRVFAVLETCPSLSRAREDILEELLGMAFPDSDQSGEIVQIVEELDAFIRAHYTETISLAELAEKYHFNPSYLTRIFKREKGVAPLKLINTLRIHDARTMLTEGQLSVREISEMLGFSNQHYFSRIFKDFTGMTPKEYRGLSRSD